MNQCIEETPGVWLGHDFAKGLNGWLAEAGEQLTAQENEKKQIMKNEIENGSEDEGNARAGFSLKHHRIEAGSWRIAR